MNFSEAIKSVFAKYVTFSGRARRSEYWYFSLFSLLTSIAICILSLSLPKVGVILNVVFSLGIILPSLAVQTRRLHDVGKSGWLIVWLYVLIYGALGTLLAGVGLDNLIVSQSRPEAVDYNTMNLPLLMAGLGLYVVAIGYSIYMLVLACRNSQIGDNQYGPNPKGEEEIASNENF